MQSDSSNKERNDARGKNKKGDDFKCRCNSQPLDGSVKKELQELPADAEAVFSQHAKSSS